MPINLGSSTTPRDHLIVPDEHAYPGDNFRRFKWLGEYILEHKPSVIVRLGDMWDMTSLCSYDKGKKSFVFQNIKDDIESGHKAEKLIFSPMLKHNAQQKRNKAKQYRPTIIKLLGNHEARLSKLLEYEPRWEGSIDMSVFNTRLDIKEEVIPFQDFVAIDGIAYSHYFVSGVMGRPCASARALMMKKVMSCTMGHTHLLDTAHTTKPTGENIRALIGGSFHDPDHKSFAGEQVDELWWNGLLHKHDVLDGDYDLEEIRVERLQRMYG